MLDLSSNYDLNIDSLKIYLIMTNHVRIFHFIRSNYNGARENGSENCFFENLCERPIEKYEY